MSGAATIGEVGDGGPTPLWMQIARAYLDKKISEVRGGEQPDIIRFFKEIGKPEFNEDEIPWCAAFVGACLYEANMGHNNSAWAADYGKWSGADRVVDRKDAQRGDIMVMTRNGGGHVCFLEKDNGNGTFEGLGGNQSDAVTISTQNWNRVTYVMRPNGTGTPKLTKEDAKNVPLSLPEIGVGVGTGVVVISTVDWMTALAVCLLIAVIGYVVWKNRQKA